MRTTPSISFLLLVAAIFSAGSAAAFAREEAVLLFENRKVTTDVPDALKVTSSKDEDGIVLLKLADSKDAVSMEIRFLPDPEGRFASARARKELMAEMFNEYVESSTEKAMQFEELEPKAGAGTYCVFTDASLVGKTNLPPGQYLNLTTGLKAWPGVLAVFRCFSNDTTSAEYRALMKMLRDSVQEKPGPLK
jgi:hypothetical protein